MSLLFTCKPLCYFTQLWTSHLVSSCHCWKATIVPYSCSFFFLFFFNQIKRPLQSQQGLRGKEKIKTVKETYIPCPLQQCILYISQWTVSNKGIQQQPPLNVKHILLLISPALGHLKELNQFMDRQRNSFEGVANPAALHEQFTKEEIK